MARPGTFGGLRRRGGVRPYRRGRARVGAEATYVPGPPGQGWLALWSSAAGEPVEGADAELELILPAGTQVRRRTVRVRRLALREAIDDLVCLPAAAEVSSSVRA